MIIIDGYNVLHAAGKVHEGLGGLTVSGLLGLIQASRWAGGPAVVVCDGTGSKSGVGDAHMHPDAPVRVVFAGPGRDADSAIQRMVEEQERKGRASSVVVVSSDKGVLASAIGPLGAKAKRITSEQFVRALVEDARRGSQGSGGRAAAAEHEPLDAAAVKRWVEQFGFEAPPEQPSRGAPPRSEPEASRGVSPRNESASPGSESRATQEWPDGINPDDLDMGKWLGEKR